MPEQPNQNGSAPPQPTPQTVITIQKNEIDRLNDNRVYMMAILEEQGQSVNAEVGRLAGENSRLLGALEKLKEMVGKDLVKEAEKIIADARTTPAPAG